MKRTHLVLLIAAFVALRLALFNINIAEWGDSYDFLRIAESLTHGQYPLDAKRLPVFPLLIAIGMPFFDAVVWAKVVALLASAGCLFFTYKLTKKLFPDLSENYCLLPIAYCLISPIFLYWSIRVVAEPVFAFFVLLAFYLFYSGERGLGVWGPATFANVAGLGVVCGLAAMTRYEGFLLAAAIGLGLVIREFKGFGDFWRVVKKTSFLVFLFSCFFVLIVSPWFLRNYLVFGRPFYSFYTSDPAGFIKGAYYRWQWVFYSLFMFGFPAGFFFLWRGLWEKRQEVLRYFPILFFVSSSLLLFLVWYPRARFYLYLIPLLLPFVVVGLKGIGEGLRRKNILVLLALLAVYFVGIWHFRFYFLGPGKIVKAIVLGLGLVTTATVNRGWRNLLVSLILISEAAVSFGVISNHRMMYSSVYRATNDPLIADRKITYYDETGVSAWYLRENGIYYDQDLSSLEQIDWLRENKINLVLWTNEHNEGAELTAVSDPQFANRFDVVREYSYRVGETEFASRIYEFLK